MVDCKCSCLQYLESWEAMQSVVNLLLWDGKFHKAFCKTRRGVFKTLAVPMYPLKLFRNVKSENNRIANSPEILRSSYISHLVNIFHACCMSDSSPSLFVRSDSVSQIMKLPVKYSLFPCFSPFYQIWIFSSAIQIFSLGPVLERRQCILSKRRKTPNFTPLQKKKAWNCSSECIVEYVACQTDSNFTPNDDSSRLNSSLYSTRQLRIVRSRVPYLPTNSCWFTKY